MSINWKNNSRNLVVDSIDTGALTFNTDSNQSVLDYYSTYQDLTNQNDTNGNDSGRITAMYFERIGNTVTMSFRFGAFGTPTTYFANYPIPARFKPLSAQVFRNAVNTSSNSNILFTYVNSTDFRIVQQSSSFANVNFGSDQVIIGSITYSMNNLE